MSASVHAPTDDRNIELGCATNWRLIVAAAGLGLMVLIAVVVLGLALLSLRLHRTGSGPNDSRAGAGARHLLVNAARTTVAAATGRRGGDRETGLASQTESDVEACFAAGAGGRSYT